MALRFIPDVQRKDHSGRCGNFECVSRNAQASYPVRRSAGNSTGLTNAPPSRLSLPCSAASPPRCLSEAQSRLPRLSGALAKLGSSLPHPTAARNVPSSAGRYRWHCPPRTSTAGHQTSIASPHIPRDCRTERIRETRPTQFFPNLP